MTFRDEVNHIDQMNPHLVDATAEDFKRVVRLIDSALPVFDEVKGKTDWRGDGKELLDRRLKEADKLLEALRHEYDRAGRALDDYQAAQVTAKKLVNDGIGAEGRLGDAIRHLEDPGSQPMRTWDDLKGTDGFFDWLGELGKGDDIDAVRPEADRLYGEAGDYYARAMKTESDGRVLIVGARFRLHAEACRISGRCRARPGNHRWGTRPARRDPASGQGSQRPATRSDHHGRVPGGRGPQHRGFPRAPYNWFVQGQEMTASEARLLHELQDRVGGALVVD